jgi:hypothetical protein
LIQAKFAQRAFASRVFPIFDGDFRAVRRFVVFACFVRCFLLESGFIPSPQAVSVIAIAPRGVALLGDRYSGNARYFNANRYVELMH